jgi:hypothetical protein
MQNQIPNEIYLTANQASKKYFYTAPTLRIWVRRGYVDGVKHANKYYLGEKSLKVFLKARLENS